LCPSKEDIFKEIINNFNCAHGSLKIKEGMLIFCYNMVKFFTLFPRNIEVKAMKEYNISCGVVQAL